MLFRSVSPAPFAVNLFADDTTYVEPDVSVVCDRDKLSDRGCEGAPDIVVEVVSPSNPEMDYISKLHLYDTAGVREYWICDPERERTTVYRFEDGRTFSKLRFDTEQEARAYAEELGWLVTNGKTYAEAYRDRYLPDVPILHELPDGWKVDRLANTAPRGTVWVHNGPIFKDGKVNPDYRHALMYADD